MELSGSTAVVTGAGSGIGRAIASRLAADGVRVVVNDLDVAAAEASAAEIGAVAISGDAASEAGVEALITAAIAELGRIDLYVANAGVGTTHGLDASEDDWARSWDVNVMAHVRAARRLVPDWLERGEGRFVVTASAAGLLTMLGDAPYSVNTPMYQDSGPLRAVLDLDPVLDPDAVANALIEAMDDGRFLVLPHPQVKDYFSYRATDPDRWLRGMRKIQNHVDSGLAL